MWMSNKMDVEFFIIYLFATNTYYVLVAKAGHN